MVATLFRLGIAGRLLAAVAIVAGVAALAAWIALDGAASRPIIVSAALIGAAGVLLASVVVLYRAVLRPLRGIAEAMRAVAAGNGAMVVPGGERQDEIGALARVLADCRAKVVRHDELRREFELQRQL
jgi:methyl-accepting chemotaxis protein